MKRKSSSTDRKLTKGVISKAEAEKLAPEFVVWVENKDFDVLLDKVIPRFEKLKRGETVLANLDGQYVRCKVTSMNSDDIRAVDGPIVRVGNGEMTWRVDGCGYCFPIPAA